MVVPRKESVTVVVISKDGIPLRKEEKCFSCTEFPIPRVEIDWDSFKRSDNDKRDR